MVPSDATRFTSLLVLRIVCFTECISDDECDSPSCLTILTRESEPVTKELRGAAFLSVCVWWSHPSAQVRMPCTASEPLIRGELSFNLTTEAVAVDGGEAEIEYDCITGVARVAARVASASVGNLAKMSSVQISLNLSGPKWEFFSGNVSGAIGLADLMPTGVPGLPIPDAGLVSTPTVGDARVFWPSLSLIKDAGGLRVGKLRLPRIPLDALLGSGAGDASSMAFYVTGFMDVTYPCGPGDVIAGHLTLTAEAPGFLEVNELGASVTHRCGCATAVPNGPEPCFSRAQTEVVVDSADPVRIGQLTVSGKARYRLTTSGHFTNLKQSTMMI